MNQQTFQDKISIMLSNRITVGIILSFILYLAYIRYLSLSFLGILFCWTSSTEIVFELERTNKKSVPALFLYFLNNLCVVACIVSQDMTEIKLNDLELENDLLNICIINIFSDVAQYVGGKLFGRNLTFPEISPRKTWEGYLFGTISSLILAKFIDPNISLTSVYIWLICGYIGGILSSLAKRELEIKDWSRFLGNHGGFADRTDSIILPVLLRIFHFI
jgi:predicted CDP-diglyceride synthetase/phosphatidate cytidylyltransferase